MRPASPAGPPSAGRQKISRSKQICRPHCHVHVRPAAESIVKYFSRAERLRTWTANSPASSMPHPSCTRRFRFGGSTMGADVVNSWFWDPEMVGEKRGGPGDRRQDETGTGYFRFELSERKEALTVLRTIRITDSIAPRFSVPSFTWIRCGV